LRISARAGKDFVDSLFAVVTEALEEGSKVNIFGLVTLRPAFRLPLPKRKGTDPRTGETVTRPARPASVLIRATVPKKIKDGAPTVNSKAGKELRTDAETRKAAAEKRARAKERELAKAGR
jgi:nucleoid DNA-binding protein